MDLKVSILGFILLIFIMAKKTSAGPYFDDDVEGLPVEASDYSDNALEDLMRAAQQKRSQRVYVYRRGCVRRDGNCDHRPNDCCYSSSCRCNLWGSNCRCQRMGLFQKWG
ncbi:toxin Tbo-IT2-like isoform X1 [Aphidius gifuensis]|uniref:toxin Tbo-IT2-like isoform X1 n=1 Tax=Aphidius gifuensis TaxID=684658 RepID=UPI001CDC9DF6|nr:toxin Tbo-IT2-like isoform X1 [Aphidius gifuensis]